MTSTPRARTRAAASATRTGRERTSVARGERAPSAPRTTRRGARASAGPIRDDPRAHDPTWTVLVRAFTAGAVVAAIGLSTWLVVTLSAWVLSAHGTSSPTDPVRLAVALWAWSNHAGMVVRGAPVGLTPLGLMAVPLALCWAGGRHLARVQRPADLSAAARLVGLFAGGYVVVGTVVTVVAAGDVARVPPAGILVWGLVVAVTGSLIGLVRGAGLSDQVVDLVPVGVRPVLVAGTGAAFVVVAAAAVLTAVGLAASLPESAGIADELHAGVLGGLLVALLGLAFVPNLVLWVSAVLVGPGFAVGTGSEVSARLVEYGPLPAFPPVAALPPEGVVPAVGWLVLLLPLAAGVLSGLVMARRVTDGTHQMAARAAASGLVAGVWLGGLAWLSAGGLGGHRLSVVGPAAVRVGVTAALEVGLVAAVTAWEANRRGWGAQRDPARRFAWRNVWPGH